MALIPPDDLVELRNKLPAETGLSRQELMRRAAEYSLTPEQSATAEKFSDVDYLLEVD